MNHIRIRTVVSSALLLVAAAMSPGISLASEVTGNLSSQGISPPALSTGGGSSVTGTLGGSSGSSITGSVTGGGSGGGSGPVNYGANGPPVPNNSFSTGFGGSESFAVADSYYTYTPQEESSVGQGSGSAQGNGSAQGGRIPLTSTRVAVLEEPTDVVTVVSEAPSENSESALVAAVAGAGLISNWWMWALLVILLIIAAVYGFWYFSDEPPVLSEPRF